MKMTVFPDYEIEKENMLRDEPARLEPTEPSYKNELQEETVKKMNQNKQSPKKGWEHKVMKAREKNSCVLLIYLR